MHRFFCSWTPDRTSRRTRGRTPTVFPLALLVFLAAPTSSAPLLEAQEFPTDDPVLERIWTEGTERSRAASLAQTLLDSIGPRLTGTPGQEAAAEWAVGKYRKWGIETWSHEYGTWEGWERGVTHVDLLEPRVRTLRGTMLAWSPGTDGPVTGDVVVPPEVESDTELVSFLDRVDGRFVLLSFPEPTCRPDGSWEEWAREDEFRRMRREREEARTEWQRRLAASGGSPAETVRLLEEAGAAGLLTSRWSGGWGANQIFSSPTRGIPSVDLSCEDYGLLFRLAENGQSPRIRLNAEAEELGRVPVANTLASISGTERPHEHVLLSAHFDSWDGASGATDNGTGTVVMMEAMRILRAVHPEPTRTILVGHWNGEEQGLNGSRAFVADHPEIVEGLQALFNQDTGTGGIARISMEGLLGAAPFMSRWLTAIPEELSDGIDLVLPGVPSTGGTDHASFICAGAPAFSLSSDSWDYGPYTWHTNLDTFDKISVDEVRRNAVLVAMLAYLAAEEGERIPRDRRVMPVEEGTGEPGEWPRCRDGARSAPAR